MAEHIEKAQASGDFQEPPRVQYTFGSTINTVSHTAGAKSSHMRPMRKTAPREASPHDEYTDLWDDRLVALQQIIRGQAAQVGQSQIEDQSRFAVQPLLDALPSIVPTPLSSSIRRPQLPLQRAFVFAGKKEAIKPKLPSTHLSSPLHPSEVLSITEARSFVEDKIQTSCSQLQTWHTTFSLKPSEFQLRLSKPTFWKRVEGLVDQLRVVADFLETGISAQELTVGMLWNKIEVRQILEKTEPVWESLRVLGLGYHGLRFKDGVGRELWRIEKVFKRFMECRTVVKKSDSKGERAQMVGTKTVAMKMESKIQLPRPERQDTTGREATQSEFDIATTSLEEELGFGASQTEKEAGESTTQKGGPTCATDVAKIDAPDHECADHHAPEAEVDSGSSSDSEDGGVDLA
ncbi:unnamed protein product [Zymoseptoria tritici ST99CH_1A5]|uniref:Uncharacterized protein n=1 Tax=Zymoseptoria tritici ST99CH_1A5 TaxID=1276529 RepID=A0A1Y6LIW0_ZYMTR|nr:unnamed protein product [Zymoseptoria tritici ST99CH_1A5]